MWNLRQEHQSLRGVTFFVLFFQIVFYLLQAPTFRLMRILVLVFGARPTSLFIPCKSSEHTQYWKLGGKQLVSHSVTAAFVFLGLLHIGEQMSPVLCLNHHHSGGDFQRSAPTQLLSPCLTPFLHCRFFVPLPFVIPSSAGETDFVSGATTSTPTPQSTSLHLYEKPCNSPQWAIPGMKMGKGNVNTSNSFFYFMGLYFIQDGPQNEN